jgi:hypothetical protein
MRPQTPTNGRKRPSNGLLRPNKLGVFQPQFAPPHIWSGTRPDHVVHE